MTAEEWIILLVRVAGSLPVLRWPLAGGVLAVLVDLSDLFLRGYIDLGGVSDYQAFDKWLDQFYLALFLVVALRWEGPERTVAVALYLFRLAGFAAFEVTGERWVLLAFPNVFEFWFLFVAGLHRFRPGVRLSVRGLAIAFAVVTAAKLFQEYALHSARWLDTFSVRDVVEFVTRPFG